MKLAANRKSFHFLSNYPTQEGMLGSLKFLVCDRPPFHSLKKYFLTHCHRFRAGEAKDHSEKPLLFPMEETDSEREGGMTSPLSNSVRAGHFPYAGLRNTTLIEDCKKPHPHLLQRVSRAWSSDVSIFKYLSTLMTILLILIHNIPSLSVILE